MEACWVWVQVPGIGPYHCHHYLPVGELSVGPHVNDGVAILAFIVVIFPFALNQMPTKVVILRDLIPGRILVALSTSGVFGAVNDFCFLGLGGTFTDDFCADRCSSRVVILGLSTRAPGRVPLPVPITTGPVPPARAGNTKRISIFHKK